MLPLAERRTVARAQGLTPFTDDLTPGEVIEF